MDENSGSSEVSAQVRELEKIIEVQQSCLTACNQEVGRLKNIVDSTHEMIQNVLPDGKVAFVNRGWAQSLGFEEIDYTSAHFTDSVQPQLKSYYEGIFQSVIDRKQAHQIETVFARKDGNPLKVYGDMQPLIIDGDVVSVQIFVHDITELSRAWEAEERLLELKDALIDSTLMVSKNLDLQVTLKETLRAARKLSDACYAAIAVVEKGKVKDFIHEGMPDEVVRKISSCPPQKGLISAILKNPETLMLDNIGKDHRSYGFPENHPAMEAYIGTPVVFDSVLHGVIYLTKKSGEKGFTAQDCTIIENFAAHAAVAIHNAKLYDQVKRSSLETIHRLAKASEYKDEDTGAHIRRMSYYSAAIARTMGLDSDFVETILHAAAMHDVGKIGTPDRVLLKPGKLDSTEWDIMKQHTLFGSEILDGADNSILQMACEIALTHQEKYDGSGYPGGLSGEDIPLAGRIVAVADVFDALTMKRPYKPAFSLSKAYGIMEEGRGVHFDPIVLDAFFKCEEEILMIKGMYSDDPVPEANRFFEIPDTTWGIKRNF
jgi:PAS domain S-box-containing protein